MLLLMLSSYCRYTPIDFFLLFFSNKEDYSFEGHGMVFNTNLLANVVLCFHLWES